MVKRLNSIVDYLQVGIWQVDENGAGGIAVFFQEALKKLILTIRFFLDKRVTTMAAALTYSTLLAIVPILAVVFAIARGFGYSKYIEVWFRDAFSSQPQAAEIIIGFVNSYLVHTKSGIFLGIGLLFMLYTVLMLVSNIEETINTIWQVKKSRSIFRTFTDYLAMFFIFPIIIVLTSGITIFMATVADSIPHFLLLGPVVLFFLDLLPYVLMSALFIGFYIFMPNTHVKVSSVIVPGIIAGIAMQGLQYVYVNSQVFLSSYNAIYGSFAALPLFMLWLQISWTICLFGAELCYTNQYLEYYDFNTQTSDISHRYRLMLCGLLMSAVCKRFDKGGKPYTATELRQETGIPIRIVLDLLYQLIEAHLLIEISNDEKGDTSQYIPAQNTEYLSVGTMIDRLESMGKWKIKLPHPLNDTENWRRTIEIRSRYLKESRNILLKDL